MKNSIINLIGLLILGVCMIISSVIFSNAINSLTNQNHIVNGSLGVNQYMMSPEIQSEYMAIGEVARLFGYDDINIFTQDVLSLKLNGLPYVNNHGKLIFSRTAFEEWLVESARQHKDLSLE